MSGAPLRFVLGLLRRLKSGSECGMGHSALNHVEHWARGGGQEAQFKLLIAIQSNLQEARETVERSGLLDEAKAGLFATIDTLVAAFSVGGMTNAVSNYVRDIDQSLTIFAFVTSAMQFDVPEEFVHERDALIDDLKLFIGELSNLDLDDRLRDAARRQISLIIALLKNAEAVGVEAALASYYEMVIKLRNRFAQENDEGEDSSKFWSTVRSWSERFDSLSKLYDVAQRLLPHLDKIPLIPGF